MSPIRSVLSDTPFLEILRRSRGPTVMRNANVIDGSMMLSAFDDGMVMSSSLLALASLRLGLGCRVRVGRVTALIDARDTRNSECPTVGRTRTHETAAFEAALRVPLVEPTGYVVHDTHPYSVPPDSVGMACNRDRVRSVAGRHVTEHPRKFGRDEGSTLPEHRRQRVQFCTQREHLVRTAESAVSPMSSTWLAHALHAETKSSSAFSQAIDLRGDVVRTNVPAGLDMSDLRESPDGYVKARGAASSIAAPA